ncbi:MAG: alpha-hydroxy-acid oxidizing protein [Rhodospirillales bacterium]|nr:alpha-hydroxy-acid oxidizing protein [Rhodospirillales bacterium]
MADKTLGAYNIADLREMAKRRLPRGIFEFVDRGAEDEVALRNNRQAFEGIKLKSRVLADVSSRSLETTLFGKTYSMPLGISPTGTAGLLSYGGEIAIAQAAAKANIPYTVATPAMTSMEEIAEQVGGELWFQLYVWADKAQSYKFVERVKSVGYKTLIVTVDSVVGYNREYNHKNGFEVPLKYTPRMLAQLLAKPGWFVSCLLPQLLRRGIPKYENYPAEMKDKITAKTFDGSKMKNDTLHWDDLKVLRDRWPGTLMVKGILHPDDAALAAACGADGVIVSNHGGRNLDASVAPIQILPEIAARVGGKTTVIVDSGFRRGTDVIKGLALGADFVMTGRPTLYGTAVAGEAGAARAIEIFGDEINRVMGQLGLHSIDEITRDCLWEPSLSP